jgi:hypothetical protein
MGRRIAACIAAGAVALSACSGEGGNMGTAAEALADSVVRVPRSALRVALEDASSCRPADAAVAGWPGGVRSARVGNVIIHHDGRVSVFDADAVRVISVAGGAPAAVVIGSRGTGPGQFSDRALIRDWAADTIAVFDPAAGRISLFTPTGFARDLSTAAVRGIGNAAFLGRLTMGELVFQVGAPMSSGPDGAARVRAPFHLMRWDGVDSVAQLLYDDLNSLEMLVERRGAAVDAAGAAFARGTYAQVAGEFVVLRDNTGNAFVFIDAQGRATHAVAVDVDDPEVTAAEKDSVRAARASDAARRSPALRALMDSIPDRRPAYALDADNQNGIWLTFDPPVSAGGRLHVRIDRAGQADRCYRPAAGERTAAFSREMIAVRVDSAGTTRVELRRTTEVPR